MRYIYTVIFILLSIIYYSNSEEKIEYNIDDNLLTVNINNLSTNCCSGYLVDYYINNSNNTITFNIIDTTAQKCKCNCNIDLKLSLGPIAQGKYNINIFKEELVRYGYPKDRKINLSKREMYVYDPHPKSPLILEFQQSACKNTNENQNDDLLKSGVEIFPNPASSSVSVRFAIKEQSNITIKILNFLGKEINEYKFKNLRAGTNTLHLDLSDLQPGIYIGKIIGNSGQNLNFKLSWSK